MNALLATTIATRSHACPQVKHLMMIQPDLTALTPVIEQANASHVQRGLLTKGVDEKQVNGGMKGQHNGTGHHLWLDNLLCLQVVGGCDVGGKPPHPWQ